MGDVQHFGSGPGWATQGSPSLFGVPLFPSKGEQRWVPDLQRPQLLLQPPRLLLQVQVLHGEGAHVLGGTQKPTRVSNNPLEMLQMPPQSNQTSPTWWVGGSRGCTGTQTPFWGVVSPLWLNHLSQLGDAAGSLRGGRRIRSPPVCRLLLHGSAVWG